MGRRSADTVRTVTVPLTHPNQLFAAAGVSPSSPEYSEFTAQPAMETVRDELLAHMPTSHTEVVLEVVLPTSHVHPDLDIELTDAVRRWLRVQNTLDGDTATAMTSLATPLIIPFAIAFLALQVLSMKVRGVGNDLNDFLIDAIGEGLSVSSWVLLWFLVQNATVDAFRSRVRRKRMRTIERMTVRVVPAGAPS